MIKLLRIFRNKIIRLFSLLQFKLNRVQLGHDIVMNGIPYIVNKGVLSIGNSVKMNLSFKYNPIGGERRMTFIVAKDGVLEIKDNAGISNSAFFCSRHIVVEEDVYIGGGCKIYDTDFHSINYIDRILLGDINVKSAPVTIKKGAFIGGHSIILKGVTVGQYAVIGAGSVLSKSVPDRELWAGNPARFVKKII